MSNQGLLEKQTTETRKRNIQKATASLKELTYKTTSDQRLTCNAITEELIAEKRLHIQVSWIC